MGSARYIMALELRRRVCGRLVAALVVVAATAGLTAQWSSSALAADNTSQYAEVTGPGTRLAGRAVNLRFGFSVDNVDGSLAPHRVGRLAFAAKDVHFEASAVPVCRAKIRNDGLPTPCPSSTRVGKGKFAGTFGMPDQPKNTLGALANARGTISCFNLAPRRRDAARILVVLKTSAPVSGAGINIVVPVSRVTRARVAIPDVPQLPKVLRGAFPKGTRLIVQSFDAVLRSSHAGHVPFMISRRIDAMRLGLTASYDA